MKDNPKNMENKFELELQEKSEILVKCQQDKATDTCSCCDEFIGCKTRKEYVSAVYSSMNHGDTGGFEF